MVNAWLIFTHNNPGNVRRRSDDFLASSRLLIGWPELGINVAADLSKQF
jgi:hypothetical protein